jgi:hypothetical protein
MSGSSTSVTALIGAKGSSAIPPVSKGSGGNCQTRSTW